jgi:hypothetical protein
MEPGKDKQTRLVGAPDVVKATCPVRGALGGNLLPRGSMDAVPRLHYRQVGSEENGALKSMVAYWEANQLLPFYRVSVLYI